MIDKKFLLNSLQMAEFVARGFLRFDELVPGEINERVMARYRPTSHQTRAGRYATLAMLSRYCHPRAAGPATDTGIDPEPGRQGSAF